MSQRQVKSLDYSGLSARQFARLKYKFAKKFRRCRKCLAFDHFIEFCSMRFLDAPVSLFPNTKTNMEYLKRQMRKNVITINSLPEEILVMIFRLVPIHEVQTTLPRVSKKWKRLSQDYSVQFRRLDHEISIMRGSLQF